MLLNLIIGFSVFLSIALFASWALQRTASPADARLRSLATDRQRGGGLAAVPFGQRVVSPLVESLGGRVASILPGAFLSRAERRLVLAGQPMQAATSYTLMFGMGALMAGGYLVLVLAAAGSPSPLALLPAPFFAVIGVYIVNFWLSSQARARQGAMLKALPDSMDLLTICVEAGLGLDAAFYRVAEKQTGPLVDEIRTMLREIGLGKARRDALLDLAVRTDLEDIRTFVNAVNQAEQLGTSLAQVLRVQSERLRVRRRQRSEQEARKVPVKMVFPLVFCLMPALFIFIIGPIIVKALSFLSSQ